MIISIIKAIYFNQYSIIYGLSDIATKKMVTISDVDDYFNTGAYNGDIIYVDSFQFFYVKNRSPTSQTCDQDKLSTTSMFPVVPQNDQPRYPHLKVVMRICCRQHALSDFLKFLVSKIIFFQ